MRLEQPFPVANGSTVEQKLASAWFILLQLGQVRPAGLAGCGLLARAGAGIDLVQGGAKHLVLSRSGGGHWGSTHNTAVAFSALNSLSELTPIKSMTVEVFVDGTAVDRVTIDESNKDLTFLTDLRPWFVSGGL